MELLAQLRQEIDLLRAEQRALATKVEDSAAIADDTRPVYEIPPLMRPGFRVKQTGKATVSVDAGYAQGQTGALTSVSAVASITISAETYIFARYNLGEVAVSSPGWETVSGTIIQSAATLPTPDDQYRVIPIAHITWSSGTSAVNVITQHHVGMLPCPDMELPGKVVPFNVPHGTVKYGWKPCDGSNSTVDVRKKFISGSHASGILAAGAETATITAASLMAAQGDHIHMLNNVSTDSVQGFDAGNLGGGPIGLEQLAPDTFGSKANFTSDLTPAIIPPNVAMPYYEHL